MLDEEWSATVRVVRDRASVGTYEGRLGEILVTGLRDMGATGIVQEIVPDEIDDIQKVVRDWIDPRLDVILVTGGTGISPRDQTPEAIEPLLQIQLPGVIQALRQYGQDRMKSAMFSRSVAGAANSSIIIAIPGSPGACQDALNAPFPALLHAKGMSAGGGHS